MRLGSRLVVLLASLAGSPILAAAQDQAATLSGRVSSADGEPLVQATVLIERWSLGATTRADGRYSITIPAARFTGDTMSVTARLIGYKPRTIRVVLSGQVQTLDFALEPNPLQPGEIVVTGLGAVSEVEKLGTVRNSIDSAQIVRSGEQNLVNSLAAKAPNVTVTSSSGDPGASSYMQIRGLTTISAQDGQPLIVVDGVSR
jgi:carboxypeptidase family protein/TonB-dependent receptor-like protein